jgi:hypothetical protein
MARRKPDEEILDLFRQSGSGDKASALEAQRQIALAFSEDFTLLPEDDFDENQDKAVALDSPLRKGVLFGDVVGNIFEPEEWGPGDHPEYPLDLLAPGTEGDHIAYTMPQHGRIPERHVESDYIMIHTYMMANSIDFLRRYAREANWNVVTRALEVMRAGFIKKMNDDAWHTLLSAVVDRNILVFDDDAAASQFTKRLLSLMKVVMRRNAGGNTGSSGVGRLTDVFMSIEGIEDIRNWGVDQLDDVSRNRVYNSADNGAPLTRIFGLDLHDMYELGDGQQYQNFFVNDLSGAIESSDTELIVGLDLSMNDSFVMPVKMDVQVYEDEALHRSGRQGYYAESELGFGVLDNRRVIAGSF